MLDSSFLALCSHEPARAPLAAIAEVLDTTIATEEALEGLRGALEHYARAQSKIDRQELRPKKKGMSEVYDRLQERTARFREQDADVGNYRLETLVFP